MKAIPIILISALLSAVVAITVIRISGPSTEQLDIDIKTIDSQLTDTKVEAEKYTGGAILAEIELKANILQNTKIMLEQKRISILRGINIVYKDTIERTLERDPNIEAELTKATNDAKDAHQEAALYNGGLIQMMALMREATAKLTEASIQQRLELERAGISIPVPKLPSGKSLPSAGKTTSDKDAL